MTNASSEALTLWACPAVAAPELWHDPGGKQLGVGLAVGLGVVVGDGDGVGVGFPHGFWPRAPQDGDGDGLPHGVMPGNGPQLDVGPGLPQFPCPWPWRCCWQAGMQFCVWPGLQTCFFAATFTWIHGINGGPLTVWKTWSTGCHD
jgi:hypothetical protein